MPLNDICRLLPSTSRHTYRRLYYVLPIPGILIPDRRGLEHEAYRLGSKTLLQKGGTSLPLSPITTTSTSALADLFIGRLTLTSCPTCWTSLSLVACRRLISRWCPFFSYLLTIHRSLHPLALVLLTQRSLQRLPRPIPTGIRFEPILTNI
jgi:hypothetical protein